MNTTIKLLFIAASVLLFAGCNSGSTQPHSYCHKLKTRINSSTQAANVSNMNPATQARLTQEYKSLDCDQ